MNLSIEQYRNLVDAVGHGMVGRPDAHVLARFAVQVAISLDHEKWDDRDKLIEELEPLAQEWLNAHPEIVR